MQLKTGIIKRKATTLKCTRCKLKPRTKKSLRCASCKRDVDPKYWAKKAWGVFSEYIRRRGADWKGEVSCYTCGKVKHYKEMQAGHFAHKGNQNYRAIDFEPKHLRPQCYWCNSQRHGAGMSWEFGQNLEQEYGKDWLLEIKRRRKIEPALTIEELKEIYAKYSLLNNSL